MNNLETIQKNKNYEKRLSDIKDEIAKIISIDKVEDVSSHLTNILRGLEKYFDVKMPRSNFMIKFSQKDPQILTLEFSIFWSVYPVKKSGISALKAYRQLVNDRKNNFDTSLPTILIGLLKQIKEREFKQKIGTWVPYWKNPDTWLRNYCFEDITIFDSECAEKPIQTASESKSMSQAEAIKNLVARVNQSKNTYDN